MTRPTFRIWTQMIAVAVVGTVVFCEAYVGLTEVRDWWSAHQRAQSTRRLAEQFEAGRLMSAEHPDFAFNLSLVRNSTASDSRYERECRPHLLRIACLIAVCATPLLLIICNTRRSWQRRSVGIEEMGSPAFQSRKMRMWEWMLVLVVVAISLASWKAVAIRGERLKWAALYAESADVCAARSDSEMLCAENARRGGATGREGGGFTSPAEGEEESFRAKRESEYYARMRDKYLRAARRPWLPIRPDPPEPD